VALERPTCRKTAPRRCRYPLRSGEMYWVAARDRSTTRHRARYMTPGLTGYERGPLGCRPAAVERNQDPGRSRRTSSRDPELQRLTGGRRRGPDGITDTGSRRKRPEPRRHAEHFVTVPPPERPDWLADRARRARVLVCGPCRDTVSDIDIVSCARTSGAAHGFAEAEIR